MATDNAGKDQHTVSDTMAAVRQERIQRGLSNPATAGFTTIVQDIWHARERVAKQLNWGHADYYTALAELKVIFARYDTARISSEITPRDNALMKINGNNQEMVMLVSSDHQSLMYYYC